MQSPGKLIKTKWFAGTTSVVLSIASITMFSYYSKLHWYLAGHWKELPAISRQSVMNKMALLHCNWVLGLIAIAFAVSALKTGPRWLALIALAPAIVSALTIGVIQ